MNTIYLVTLNKYIMKNLMVSRLKKNYFLSIDQAFTHQILLNIETTKLFYVSELFGVKK